MHSASRVQLGQIPNSCKRIGMFNSDPATYLAGLAVRQSSTALALTLLKTGGQWLGVSVGASLSDHKKTAVAYDGLEVPMRASLKRATGVVTISSYANLLTTTPDTIVIGGVTFTAQSGAATLGQAVFRAATSNTATGTSLAVQVNAHATASLVVFALDNADGTVTLYSVADGVGSTGTGNDSAVTYTDNGGGNIGITLSGLSGGKLSGGSDTISDIAYMTKGAKAYINDITGKLDIGVAGLSTVSDAIYVTEEITGMDESGVDCAAALVWMAGGL